MKEQCTADRTYVGRQSVFSLKCDHITIRCASAKKRTNISSLPRGAVSKSGSHLFRNSTGTYWNCQCSGSGSTYFCASRIRIFLESSKNSKKTLIPTVLRLLLDFLSLKNDVNVPSKKNELFLHYFFVGVLKVNDENSMIRIRIH